MNQPEQLFAAELLHALKVLDAAVYRGIICNPDNGLEATQFAPFAKAHAVALEALKLVEAAR